MCGGRGQTRAGWGVDPCIPVLYIAAQILSNGKWPNLRSIPSVRAPGIRQNGQPGVVENSIVEAQKSSYKFVGEPRRPLVGPVHLSSTSNTTIPKLEST